MQMREYYQDLREFLGVTDQDIELRGNTENWRAGWKKAWDAKPRTTPEAIRSAYNETDSYLFRNVWFNCHTQQGVHAKVARAVQQYCAQKPREPVRLLDYGCAAGCLAKLLLSTENLLITLADVPSPTLEFARWRYRNEPQVDFIEIEEQECLTLTYDIIVCCDVLEHIPEPMATMRHLADHHKPSGLLFLLFTQSLPVGSDVDEVNPLGHLRASIAQYGSVTAYIDEVYDKLGRIAYRKKGAYKENPELEDDMVEALFRRWRRGGYLLERPQRQIYENIATRAADKTVCDVGSGSGLGVAILAQEAQSVTGIEKVAGSVRFSRKCFPLKNVQFLNEDITVCSLPSESFDVVVAVEVVEHIANYWDALSQIARILRKSGTLYISSPNRNKGNRGGASSMGPPRNKYHVREWTAGEFLDVLSAYFSDICLYDYTLARPQTADTLVSPVIAVCKEFVK